MLLLNSYDSVVLGGIMQYPDLASLLREDLKKCRPDVQVIGEVLLTGVEEGVSEECLEIVRAIRNWHAACVASSESRDAASGKMKRCITA